MFARGRFADDLSSWKKKLSPELEIEPVDDGKCLRFYLTTENDFKSFKGFIAGELRNIKFLSNDDFEESELVS